MDDDLDRRSDWESSYAMEHKVLPWHDALYVSWRLTAWQMRHAPQFAEELAGKATGERIETLERIDAVVGLLAVRIWEAAYRDELLRVADAPLSKVGEVNPEALDALLAGPPPVESDEGMWRRLAEGHASAEWVPIRLAVGEVLNAHLHAAEEAGTPEPTVQARIGHCPVPGTDRVSALLSAEQRARETARLLPPSPASPVGSEALTAMPSGEPAPPEHE